MTSEQTQAGLERCPEHDNVPLRDGECKWCGWKPTTDQVDLGLLHVKELRAKLKTVAKNDPLVPKRTGG